MSQEIEVAGIPIEVVRKEIRNVHLGVYPPDGRVRIAAPLRVDLETLRVFAVTRLRWIRQQRHKLREQDREPRRDYVDRESHYLWGTRYLLRVVEGDRRAGVDVSGRRMTLFVRPGWDRARREQVVARWYRDQTREVALALLPRWESALGVRVRRLFVQRMKTKWGSCNQRHASIRLNSELAKKPKECLEYVLVHELVHLIERRHGVRFLALLNDVLPGWAIHRRRLNRLPIGSG